MKISLKIKFLFLLATATLFSYRVALLQHQNEMLHAYQVYQAQTTDVDFSHHDERTAVMVMLAESIEAAPKAKIASAADKHNYTTKYNTQLEHYAYIVAGLVEKNECKEAILKKIEQELVVLQKAALSLGIDGLINYQLIESIKNSISYLRKQASSQREKVNNI